LQFGKRLTRTFPRRAQAEDWVRRTQGAQALGLPVSTATGSVPTLAEALERYLTEVTPAKARNSQKERYMATALARKPVAAMPLDRITSSHISELIFELEQSGLSGTRIRLYLALPRAIGNWSLTSLQQRLVKTGGRLVKHARYYWLLLAESHLTRRLFSGMLSKIAALPLPAG
jgi:hypothetical protein